VIRSLQADARILGAQPFRCVPTTFDAIQSSTDGAMSPDRGLHP
jgi:hypothetical protein